jgi:hypothetical protein
MLQPGVWPAVKGLTPIVLVEPLGRVKKPDSLSDIVVLVVSVRTAHAEVSFLLNIRLLC